MMICFLVNSVWGELTVEGGDRIVFCFFHLFEIHIEKMAFMIWIECPILFINKNLIDYVKFFVIEFDKFVQRYRSFTLMHSLNRSVDALNIL